MDSKFPIATASQVGKYLRRMVKSMKYAWPRVLLALVLLGLGAWGSVLVPRLLGRIVDVVRAHAQVSDLLRIGILIAVAVIISAIVSAVGYYILTKISERIIADLRVDMVSTTLDMPAHRVEEAGSGDVVSRSTDDIANISVAINETLPVVTVSAFYILATFLALFQIDWHYAVVIAVVIPIYMLAAWRYLRIAPQRYASERSATAQLAQYLLEATKSRLTVRAFRLEHRMDRELSDSSLDVTLKAISARTPMIWLMFWTSIAELGAMLTVLYLGFNLVTQDVTTVGAVTAAGLLVIRMRGPVMNIMRILDVLQSGYASLARVVGIVQDPPAPRPGVDAPEPVGDFLLDDVAFSYAHDAQAAEHSGDNSVGSAVSWAVEDIDLHVPPGHSLSMVGTTGAGKSTVAALAAGLCIPERGSVTLDGVNIALLSDDQRARRIALVSQEVHTFVGTLRQDVNITKPDVADAEIMDALHRVGADWVNQWADGLDTPVGSSGFQLEPVGQQQIALARILLADPSVVIMDEATAEAGSSQAGALEAAAREVMKGRTTVIVAHRLDQAALADEIVVMEHGRIIEQGSHAELTQSDGKYAQLWDAWSNGGKTPDLE